VTFVNATGNPDFVGGRSQGGQVFLNIPSGLAPANSTTPLPSGNAFYVGNLDAIYLLLNKQDVSPLTFQVLFADSPAPTAIAYAFSYYNIIGICNIADVITVQGPYLSFNVVNNQSVASGFTTVCSAVAPNSGSFYPVDRLMAVGNGVAVAGSGSVQQMLTGQSPGPATLWGSCPNGMNVLLQTLTAGGGWINVGEAQVSTTASPATFSNQPVTVPNSSCRINLVNQTATATSVSFSLVGQR
jgi:hypothetical protein